MGFDRIKALDYFQELDARIDTVIKNKKLNFKEVDIYLGQKEFINRLMSNDKEIIVALEEIIPLMTEKVEKSREIIESVHDSTEFFNSSLDELYEFGQILEKSPMPRFNKTLLQKSQQMDIESNLEQKKVINALSKYLKEPSLENIKSYMKAIINFMDISSKWNQLNKRKDYFIRN